MERHARACRTLPRDWRLEFACAFQAGGGSGEQQCECEEQHPWVTDCCQHLTSIRVMRSAVVMSSVVGRGASFSGSGWVVPAGEGAAICAVSADALSETAMVANVRECRVSEVREKLMNLSEMEYTEGAIRPDTSRTAVPAPSWVAA